MRFEIRHIGRIALLLAAGLSVSLAFGQNANTGEIRGTVQDSTGAVVQERQGHDHEPGDRCEPGLDHDFGRRL